MYAWLWRKLPGDTLTRAYAAVVGVLVVGALLWFVVFPWLEPTIRFDHGTVGGAGTPAPTHAGTVIERP